MEEPRAPVQVVHDLEDDELEKCARQAEVDAEDHLDDSLAQLVVSKELLDEKNPANEEEDSLGGQHDGRVAQQRS